MFDDMNLSELTLAAQDNDLNAHRGLGREVLTQIALDTYQGTLPERKVDKVRLKIMRYILSHWKQVSPLLSCPAQTKKERACFCCTDVHVADCAFTNPSIFSKEKI